MLVVEKILLTERGNPELKGIIGAFSRGCNGVWGKIVKNFWEEYNKKYPDHKLDYNQLLKDTLEDKTNLFKNIVTTKKDREDFANGRKVISLNGKTPEEYLNDYLSKKYPELESDNPDTEDKPGSNSKDLYIAYKAKAEEFGKGESSQGTTETGAEWKSSNWNSVAGKDKLKSWLKENKDKYVVSYIFLNEFGQEVLGMDKNLYKSCIIQYFEKTLNFKNMTDVLNKLDPDFIFNWQKSIGTDLSNKNNIFFQVINNGFNSGLFKGDKSVLEFEFIGSYNICTEFQNNSEFKNYITQRDAIIYNPNLYQNVIKTDDRVKLINTDLKYEQGSVDRDILNRAINSNAWKSFMSDGEKEDNNKSTKDKEDITDERYIRSSREIKDTLRKISENDLKYLTKALFPKGDPKELETLNKLFTQLKRDLAF